MSLFADPICAVVAEPTAAKMLSSLAAALRQSGTCELRLDWLENARELNRALSRLPKVIAAARTRSSRIPATIIATLRRRNASGKYKGSVAEQLSNLCRAAKSGCDWCDLEIETAERLSKRRFDALRSSGARLLISFHDFRRTPADLNRVVARLDRLRGEAIKIATQCNSYADSVRVLAAARKRKDVAAIPMGELGAAARVLALRTGSQLSYASVDASTAPGQFSLRDMRETLRADRLDARTQVFGIVGNPVAHSLSPAIHNAGYIAESINAVYLPLRVDSLPDFLKAVPPLGINGFSVTIPHKQAIFRFLNAADPLATRIGAVNTVIAHRDELFGYNTDYIGVARAIERYLRLTGCRALLFGAGGAARAAAFALADAGANLSICARNPSRARELARATGGRAIPRSTLRRSEFDLIINATPVGTEGRGGSPLRANELNCRVVMDMVYRPLETPLLKLARGRRIKTISGLEMFLAQAAAQWEIWLKSPAPINIMRRAAMQELAQSSKVASPPRAHSLKKR